MLKVVGAVLSALTITLVPFPQPVFATVSSGQTPTHRQWFRKKGALWFNGFPGWPKLPLVQRLRASPFALDPVASSQPEEEESEEPEEDPEPLS